MLGSAGTPPPGAQARAQAGVGAGACADASACHVRCLPLNAAHAERMELVLAWTIGLFDSRRIGSSCGVFEVSTERTIQTLPQPSSSQTVSVSARK